MPARGRREILAALDILVRLERPGNTKADTKGKGGTSGHLAWLLQQQGQAEVAPADQGVLQIC
jgi:hypothetical protein